MHEVAGLLDFGDLCVSWAASEAAITMLYALLLSMEQAAAAAGEREAAAAGEQQAAAAGHSAPAAATSALHAALEVGRRVLVSNGGWVRGRQGAAAMCTLRSGQVLLSPSWLHGPRRRGLARSVP